MNDEKATVDLDNKVEEPKTETNLEDSKHDTRPTSTQDSAGREAIRVWIRSHVELQNSTGTASVAADSSVSIETLPAQDPIPPQLPFYDEDFE